MPGNNNKSGKRPVAGHAVQAGGPGGHANPTGGKVLSNLDKYKQVRDAAQKLSKSERWAKARDEPAHYKARLPNALKEIKKYQRAQGFLLRKRPFQRLVREVAQQLSTLETYRYVLSMSDLQQYDHCLAQVQKIGENIKSLNLCAKRCLLFTKNRLLTL